MSIIEYAKKSDIKKAVNDRFKELYPQVEISLTKLIKSVSIDFKILVLSHDIFISESREKCTK